MILKEVLDRSIQFLKDKKIESPRLDSELLISKSLGLRRIDLYLKFDQPLQEVELAKCREMIKRRSLGEPVAYLLNEKDFFGETYFVDSRVLIPRPETEILAERALEEIKMSEADQLKILDLGCGSGCLGLSLARRDSRVQVTFVDLSEGAIEVTRTNAAKLQIEDRCRFIHGDARTLEFENEEFDLILANPPYIASDDERVQPEVRKYEPHSALFSRQEGLEDFYLWSQRAVKYLKKSGWIGFEFGIDQSERTRHHFESLSLENVQILKDLSGHPRHVVGKKGESFHG